MPFGTTFADDGGVEFRLWAPVARRVALRLLETRGGEARTIAMNPGEDGWYTIRAGRARPGTLYHFVIDGDLAVCDPASRFQPQDVHGPSEIVDPAAFDWRDADWLGRPWHETVLYEIHVGTFSPEGTYAGVMRKLDYLAALGVTAIELMPLAEAPRARSWGYEGVLLFAPEHGYGRPEDLKRLVEAAHARGLMVFIDVVYNHFGPEGNHLHRYAPQFFTDRRTTPWGAAINYDGAGSRTVRDFFIHNALYWLEEFHVDGLRLDAVHAIYDTSAPHILDELATTVRAAVPGRRHVHLVLENDDNTARYLERDAFGRPRLYTAQWNDDIHHALHVLLTGETGGYYADFADSAERHLGRALAEGFAYQGEASPYRGGRRRGEASVHLPTTAFVSFLQNHDQVGNRAMGERIGRLAPPAAVRAAATVTLLAPALPLLFMGEEWSAPERFPFFCDLGPDLAAAVRQGRRREFARFPEFADPAAQARIPDPLAIETYEAAKLDWSRLGHLAHAEWLAHYRALLDVRRREIVPRLAGLQSVGAEWRMHQGNVVEVRWGLAAGAVLQAILSLADRPATGLDLAPKGRLLFSTAPEAVAARPNHSLPPWFAAWFLDEPRLPP